MKQTAFMRPAAPERVSPYLKMGDAGLVHGVVCRFGLRCFFGLLAQRAPPVGA